MTETAANILIRRIESASRWPLPFEVKALESIWRFAAFRENDRPALRKHHVVAGESWPDDRTYAVDPVAARFSEAFADMLFGEIPTIRPKKDSDQDNIDRIVEDNDLPGELHYAEQITSSEGESWWRLQSTPESTTVPVATFHSREQCIPQFVGSQLIAVAFVNEFEEPGVVEDRPVVWRHLEIQSVGRIENRLYRGSPDRLGELESLDSYSETDDLSAVIETELDEIAAGRIPNKRGRDRRYGKSDYDGIEDLLFALNEALTIGVENARLVAKRRVVVSSSSVTTRTDLVDAGDGSMVPAHGRARFDAGEDVLIAQELDAELGKENQGPFKVLEYSFDAEQLVRWQDKLVKTAASRCGLSVQMIGEGEGFEGQAEAGTALRVRLLPTVAAMNGRERPWIRQLPKILMLAQLLDQHEYGHDYTAAGEEPDVALGDPLPRDESEETQTEALAVSGNVRSRREAIRRLNPGWTDPQIDAELEAVRDDEQHSARALGLGVPPTPPPPGDAE